MTRTRLKIHGASVSTVLVAVGLAVGCGTVLDLEPASHSGPCTLDTDCPSLEMCVDATCHDTCDDDRQCSAGDTCQPLRKSKTCLPRVTGADAAMDADGVSSSPADATMALDSGSSDAGPDSGDASVLPPCGCGAPASSACLDAGIHTRLVLFGGIGDDAILGDTWEWDGSTWNEKNPSSSPPARRDAAMTAVNGCPTLFAGSTDYSGAYVNDQWFWDAKTWTRQTPSSQPPVRTDPAATALNGVEVLFGGYTDDPNIPSTVLDDLWTWNGQAWATVFPTRSPSGRAQTATATLNDVVMMFGGFDNEGNVLSDTEIWDGGSWSQGSDGGAPPARFDAVAANLNGKIVVFGGFDGSNPLGDTWTWDGSGWTEEHPALSPAPRFGASAATLGDRVVLFGGEDLNKNFADTWTWDGTIWTALSVSGPPARAAAMMTSFSTSIEDNHLDE